MKEKQQDRFLTFSKVKKRQKFRDTFNAVIYTRVSSKEQADNNSSLDTQRRQCIEYAHRKRLNVTGFFGGTYETAATDERREFNRMLAFVKRNRNVSYIIVSKYDRFSRTGVNATYINDKLMKAGVMILSVTQDVDPSQPAGAFQQNIFFIFSHFNNQTRRENMINGMETRLGEGYWPLTVPLGYTNLNPGQKSNKHKIVVNDQGKILRNAWKWKIKEGIPNCEIVERLNAKGLTINERKLSEVFRNPFYCGIIVGSFIEGRVVQGKHEAMVPVEDFLKVVDLLESRFSKSRHSDAISRELPLKLFVKCNDCGQPYTGYLQKQKNLYYYRCRTKGCCKNKSRKQLHQDFQTLLTNFEILPEWSKQTGQYLKAVFEDFNANVTEEFNELQSQFSELEQKIEGLEERFIEGEVSRELFDKYSLKFLEQKASIQEKIENAGIQSSNLENGIEWVTTIAQNLSNYWSSASYTQQTSLQRLLFPEGISYDRENQRFLTSRVNCLFLPIAELSANYKHKKTGSNFDLKFNPVKSG